MDFHVITPRGAELVLRVVDHQVEIVPSPAPAGVKQHPEGQVDRATEVV